VTEPPLRWWERTGVVLLAAVVLVGMLVAAGALPW